MAPSCGRHPGIRTNRINGKLWGGFAFTVAFVAFATAMLCVPGLRWFLLLSIPAGIAVATVLCFLNRGADRPGTEVRRASLDNLDEPPGIRIHKIPVKGWPGLLFAVGVMVLFLVGLPQVRWLFVLTLPVGILIGAALHLYHRR